jgi:hypothetical protein
MNRTRPGALRIAAMLTIVSIAAGIWFGSTHEHVDNGWPYGAVDWQ